MVNQSQEDPADLPRAGPSAAQQDAQAEGEGRAVRGPGSGHRSQQMLVDGLSIGPVVRRAQDPCPVDRRQLHATVADA